MSPAGPLNDGAPRLESAPLLEIAGLTVSQGGEVLLSDVSFSVERGTLHALVGPNGAGKTTLLSAILGQAPFTGRITAAWAHNARIGYVPQVFHVDRSLPVTVSDFLALTRQPRPVCFGVSAAAAQRISRLLDRIGLAGFERRQFTLFERCLVALDDLSLGSPC
jgi:zinc transport system ATP-binding protein